jgi:hypothetical protein
MPDEDAVVDPFNVMVAGEPVARKAGTAGSGRGPLEKDLEPTRHLVSGLPVPRVQEIFVEVKRDQFSYYPADSRPVAQVPADDGA